MIHPETLHTLSTERRKFRTFVQIKKNIYIIDFNNNHKIFPTVRVANTPTYKFSTIVPFPMS